jgi:hypothetical protein
MDARSSPKQPGYSLKGARPVQFNKLMSRLGVPGSGLYTVPNNNRRPKERSPTRETIYTIRFYVSLDVCVLLMMNR